MNRQPQSSAGSNNPRLELDELLRPYVVAKDDVESQAIVSRLLERHAEPIIRFVVSYKLNLFAASQSRFQDTDDITSDVILGLVETLQELRANPLARPIRDFKGYVAARAYRACSDYLRKKNPRRLSLKNRIRYILDRSPDLDLWKSENEVWLCGLSAWRESGEPAPASLQHVEAAAIRFDGPGEPLELSRWVFDQVGRPVRLDDLVSVSSCLLGIGEGAGEEDGAVLDRLPDSRTGIDDEVERRIHLQRVWSEITKLPPRQRCALLLNLTDPSGFGVIALLPVAGIASPGEIAAAVDMAPERLAEIWNTLPFDDVTIASHLGVTRQQVVNLRKAARERLARRTRAFARSA
jgi:RNA polymerase sigma factor (sigma-70 family)